MTYSFTIVFLIYSNIYVDDLFNIPSEIFSIKKSYYCSSTVYMQLSQRLYWFEKKSGIKENFTKLSKGDLKGIRSILWKTIPIKPKWSSIHGRLLWRLLDIVRLTETISLNGIFKTVHKLFLCRENSMWISQEVRESTIHLRN